MKAVFKTTGGKDPIKDSSETYAAGDVIFHQGDLYLYTDSKAVALATELLGQSAQDLAAQAAAAADSQKGDG